jgi:hypothetical protein
MYVNRMLKGVFGTEREESAENCIMKSFLISALCQLLYWQPNPGQ